MRNALLSAVAAALPLCFAAPALALCPAPDSVYAPVNGAQAWRSLIVFEPEARFSQRGAPLPGGQTVNLELRAVNNVDARIGEFVVSHAPLLLASPGANTVAYFVAPDGSQCRIDPTAFGQKMFQENWAYSVGRLLLQTGDTINATMTSALDFSEKDRRPDPAENGGVPCQTSNIHTHGLLVRPTKGDDTAPFGDYVLDLAAPKGHADTADQCAPGQPSHAHGPELHQTMHYSITIPPRDPSNIDDPTKSGTHPPGLYWFHPHPHGYSATQVRGGTTGLITLGSICDTATNAPGCETTPRRPRMRFMMLKDAQLSAVNVTHNPPTAEFNYGYDANAGDSPYCGDDAKAPGLFEDRLGQCIKRDGAKHVDSERWLFTINGVRYPVIADPVIGQKEIWRIANASSNATYRLCLLPERTKFDAGKNCQDLGGQRFQILSRDGVAVDAALAGANLGAHELMLMPGSRVEVAVDAPPRSGAYQLVTLGFDSGGDVWPAMALAKINFTGSAAPAPIAVRGGAVAAAMMRATNLAPKPVASDASALAPRFPSPCTWDPSWERVIMLVKKTVPNPKGGDDREEFGIISGVRPAGATSALSVFATRAGDDPQFPMGSRPLKSLAALFKASNSYQPFFGAGKMDFGYVCTEQSDAPQTWVIENWTDEDHNFHIHQSKFLVFNLSTPGPDASHPKTNNYFRNPQCEAGGECNGGDRAIQDFYRELATFAFHDSVPVPRGRPVGPKDKAGDATGCNREPGSPQCLPGRVAIQIQFSRDEQVGDFVFHCHILEHEDKGMMAQIHVAPRGQMSATPVSTMGHQH